MVDRSGIDDPVNQVERNKVASKCCSTLNLTIPTAVDDMQDTVNQLYKAWPAWRQTDLRKPPSIGISRFPFVNFL